MRDPKASWVRALRALTGNEQDDIRFNEVLARWEFMLTSADGVLRSQFWGYFDRPIDPLTGLHPFRELDDAGMVEVLENLKVSFVANPFDGAGTTRKEVQKRMNANHAEGQRRYKQAGEDFVDMTVDVGGRGSRLRGALVTGYGGSIVQRSRRQTEDATP
jgi:hypothetical protein